MKDFIQNDLQRLVSKKYPNITLEARTDDNDNVLCIDIYKQNCKQYSYFISNFDKNTVNNFACTSNAILSMLYKSEGGGKNDN